MFTLKQVRRYFKTPVIRVNGTLAATAGVPAQIALPSDACERGSYLHTVASNISQMAFDYLDAPVTVVGAHNWIVPPAELEDAYYPQPSWFLDAFHQQIKPLESYTPSLDRSEDELIALNKQGAG